LQYLVLPAIKSADDGKTAQALWRLWETANMPHSQTHEPSAMWIGGSYDTTLVKENGEWQFKYINLKTKFLSSYTEG
jgi:hypothetical protein